MTAAVKLSKLPESLRSQRLMLKAFHARDASKLAKLAGVYSVAKFTLGIPLPYSTEEAKTWIAGLAEKNAFGTEHIYALHLVNQSKPDQTLAAKSALIGAISLSIEPEHLRVEIGYWLGEAFRGAGYAQEAINQLIPEIFSAGFSRIYALCFPDNSDSMRRLRKLHFVREGRLRDHIVKWGKASDVVCFGLTPGRFATKSLSKSKIIATPMHATPKLSMSQFAAGSIRPTHAKR